MEKKRLINPIPEERKTCIICDSTFLVGGDSGRRKNRKYCSLKCARSSDVRKIQSYNPQGWNGIYPTESISTGTSGAIGELMVCSKLLAFGYDVFRSVSPAASCDLLVLKHGRTCSIEVRRGCWQASRSKNGRLNFNRKRNNSERSQADYFAVVMDDRILFIENDGKTMGPIKAMPGLERFAPIL